MNSLGVVAHRLYFYITCFGISQMHVKKSGSIVVTMKAYISFFCFCMEYGFELPCLYHIFWDDTGKTNVVIRKPLLFQRKILNS